MNSKGIKTAFACVLCFMLSVSCLFGCTNSRDSSDNNSNSDKKVAASVEKKSNSAIDANSSADSSAKRPLQENQNQSDRSIS